MKQEKLDVRDEMAELVTRTRTLEQMKKDAFDEMAETWPSGVVSRTKIEIFSGGMITPKYMANLDSLGEGCPRVKIGRRVGYRVSDLCAWLRNRVKAQ